MEKAYNAHLRMCLNPNEKAINPAPFIRFRTPTRNNSFTFANPPNNRKGRTPNKLNNPVINISQAIMITRSVALGLFFSVEAGDKPVGGLGGITAGFSLVLPETRRKASSKS